MLYDINTALERLEQNLQDLDSARKQVENTVNASNELRKIVNEYVESITRLYSDIQGWEKQLKLSQSSLFAQIQDVIGTLKESCASISEKFRSSSEATIEKFSNQNTILTERINELNTLRQELKVAMSEIVVVKDTLTNLTNILMKSQQGQDLVLENIVGSVSELPVTVKGYIDDVILQMNEKYRTFNQKINNATTGIEFIIQKQAELFTLCTNIQETCNNLKTSSNRLKQSIDEVKKTIEGVQTVLSKNININRWIMIAGIIIFTILHFVR